jgi:DHA1 family inner membrane transport protein
MLFGLALFISGVGLVSFLPSYPAFLISLVLTGLGYQVFIPAIQAYLGDQVPYARRGQAVAAVELGWSISFIIGMPFIGLLIGKLGWLSPFPLMTVLGVISFLLLRWMLPANPKPPVERRELGKNTVLILTTPAATAGLVLSGLQCAANETINLVFGIWMEGSFGLKITALGIVAMTIGVAELFGEILVGGFTDRLGKARAIGLGLSLNCLSALLLPILGNWSWGATIGLFFFYLTFEFTLVSTIPLISEILPTARATLIATNMAAIALGRAIGAGIAPFLYNLPLITGNQASIFSNTLAAVILNILALLVLRRLRSFDR